MQNINSIGDARPKNRAIVGTSGASVLISIGAEVEEFWVLDAIHVSGDKDIVTTDLQVTVAINGVTKWTMSVGNATTTPFVKEFLFPRGLTDGIKNQVMAVSVEDPGSAGILTLNVQHR